MEKKEKPCVTWMSSYQYQPINFSYVNKKINLQHWMWVYWLEKDMYPFAVIGLNYLPNRIQTFRYKWKSRKCISWSMFLLDLLLYKSFILKEWIVHFVQWSTKLIKLIVECDVIVNVYWVWDNCVLYIYVQSQEREWESYQ